MIQNERGKEVKKKFKGKVPRLVTYLFIYLHSYLLR